MSHLQTKAIIEIFNGNPYIHITKAQVTSIKDNWKKPIPVLVKINGKPTPPWHINLMPMGNGDFYLYLHNDIRKTSETKVGDTVTVDVSFDTKYKNGPMHPMPIWFKTPLNKSPKAKKAWGELTPSRQKEILRYMSWLKSDEAKERNVKKAIYVLEGNEDRYMARTWKNGK